ncbi:asparagine synthase (glutamine-hydrolyzing) [Sinorhizobium meliloti]|nr:asparagine synthase (glutamine-hydrolyzing) [Sinorhizobium meliloti]MDW9514663.1 asparagine synthase (glutamine-hydrolyzing) [Sinorhizobium meliloti]MDX0378228.1 asparagine synthase (glutamine-hydrolyzing) [Sinorhizobium meliloti]
MCGIVGYVGSPDSGLRDRMATSQRHRGPDGQGVFSAGNVHLGMSRLSIVDPGAGCALLKNEAETIVVVFNGEIYNHRELRATLSTLGHSFRTNIDTEVVIHLYEEYGPDCVRFLRGMFSFALFDGSKLLLARDRLGIKPLYYLYLRDLGIFLFASEIKALLQCDQYLPSLNMQAFADFILLGYPSGTATFLNGIVSLARGHTLTVTAGERVEVVESNSYFEWPNRDLGIDLPTAQSRLDTILNGAVRTHLNADVDVGLLLSGGLDSTVLAYIAREHRARRLQTFTVADTETHPDAILAADVARRIDSDHHLCLLDFETYLAAIPGLVAAEEAPSSLWGLPFLILSQTLSKHSKACILGEGADELFGGYGDYLDRGFRLAQFARRFPLLARLGVSPTDEAMRTVRQLSPMHSSDIYLSNLFNLNLGDQLERLHLDPVDRCAMASGVEMRVPYLDDEVFDFVARLPIQLLVRQDLGIQKYLLRHLATERLGGGFLDIVMRRKLGVPSSGRILHRRFEKLCEDVLPASYLERHELGFCFTHKWQLLMFELFHELFIENRGNADRLGGVLDALSARADSAGRRALVSDQSCLGL